MHIRLHAAFVAATAMTAACSFDPPPPLTDAAANDFQVSVEPAPFLRVGETAAMTVTIERFGIFSDPVDVAIDGLPAGVSAAPATIPSDQTSVSVTLQAEAGATLGNGTVTAVATAGALEHQVEFELLVAGMPGTFDETFGNTGIIASPASLTYPNGTGLLDLGDGRTLVCTADAGDFVAFVIDKDGAPDASFGEAGVVRISPSTDVNRASCALQSAGRIVFAGQTDTDATTALDDDVVLARITATGALDTTFGSSGIIVAPDASRDFRFEAVAIDGDDRVLVTGADIVADAPDVLLLQRHLPDGMLDPSLGTDGLATGPSEAQGRTILATSGGQIWVGTSGEASQYTTAEGGVVAFSDAGALVETFGEGGYLRLPDGTVDDTSSAVVASFLPMDDGSVLAAGYVAQYVGSVAAVWRIDGDAIDASFGEGGFVQHPMADNQTRYAASVLAQERVIAVGAVSPELLTSDVLASWIDPGTGELDTTIGNGGRVTYHVDLGDYSGAAFSAAVATPDRRVTVVVTAYALGASGTIQVARLWY